MTIRKENLQRIKVTVASLDRQIAALQSAQSALRDAYLLLGGDKGKEEPVRMLRDQTPAFGPQGRGRHHSPRTTWGRISSYLMKQSEPVRSLRIAEDLKLPIGTVRYQLRRGKKAGTVKQVGKASGSRWQIDGKRQASS